MYKVIQGSSFSYHLPLIFGPCALYTISIPPHSPEGLKPLGCYAGKPAVMSRPPFPTSLVGMGGGEGNPTHEPEIPWKSETMVGPFFKSISIAFVTGVRYSIWTHPQIYGYTASERTPFTTTSMTGARRPFILRAEFGVDRGSGLLMSHDSDSGGQEWWE